jgi:hypothetical protein
MNRRMPRDRKCSNCNSSQTYVINLVNNVKCPNWYKVDNGYLCRLCYGRYHYKQKLLKVSNNPIKLRQIEITSINQRGKSKLN